MNENPGGRDSNPPRVVAVGSSSWLEESVSALEGDGFVVSGPVEPPVDGDGLARGDCLLSDDPEALTGVTAEAIAGDGSDAGSEGASDAVSEAASDAISGDAPDPPIVLAIDDDRSAGDVLDDGISDVVRRESDPDRPMLRHRLRRAIELVDVRRTLDEREAWYRSLIERSSTLLIVLDEEGTRTYVSPALERLTGYSPSAQLGSDPSDVVHPDDVETFLEAFERAKEGGAGATASCEYRVQYADGSWHVHEAAFTNRLADPDVEGVIVSITDVTAHRQVERELNESFERVTDAFFSLDARGRFTYVNDRAQSLLDHAEDELLGREFLEAFPEARGTPFERVPLEAMEEQEPRTFRAYYDPHEMWIEARIFPSQTGVSVYFRDVTDRVEQEYELAERAQRLETLVQNVPVILFTLDEEGVFTLSEGRGLEAIGYESGVGVGQSIYDVYDSRPDILADVDRALSGEPVHAEREIEGRIFETWYRPVIEGERVERVIGVGIDVTERVQHETALETLYEATRHLLTVESKQSACDYVVDVAADVLDLSSTVVFRFDERENELVPTAYSGEYVTHIRSPPKMRPSESIAWYAFVEGRPRLFDDIRESDRVYDLDTPIRSALYVPLGEHGVLLAASTEVGVYNSKTFELLQLLGATAEAALDRIDRTQRLHERERELQRQNDRLERVNRAGRIREEVEELLLRAESRSEMERGICERLVASEAATFAWIGEPDPGGNRIVPRASAGTESGYLESVSVTAVDDGAAEPTGRAARSRSTVAVDNVAESLRNGDWRGHALSRNFQSVVSIPLVYDDFLYGVLSVYGDERDAFDEQFLSTVEELGETIGYAIDAVTRKRALASEAVVELELSIDDDGSGLVDLAIALDAPIELAGAIPQDDGSIVAFLEVGPEAEAAEIESIDVEPLSSITTIRDGEEGTLLQVRVGEGYVGSTIAELGGTVRRLVVDDEGMRAVVHLPAAVGVREFLSSVDRRGPSVSLLARREPDDETGLNAVSTERLLRGLTDRQREVAQAAYHGGFFEWPRQATGEEIASSLDISSPAFHNHVRTVERKLFTTLFDRDRRDG